MTIPGIKPFPGETQAERNAWVLARIGHYVYRMYDAEGTLLYIGCSSDVGRRIAAHESRSAKQLASRWLRVTWSDYETTGPYAGKAAGREAERQAIASEQPLFNFQERRIPRFLALGHVARYLAEHGHLELALETTCVCLPESVEVGGYDTFCYAHKAAQVAGLTARTGIPA